MTGSTVEIYDDEELGRIRRRIKVWKTALCIIAAAGLAVCIALAAMTGTANADKMELTAVAVSTVTGWIVIYGAIFVVTAGKRELRHADMLRSEERERLEGTVTVTDKRLIIRKSIAMRRVELSTEDGVRKLLVAERRAGALAAADATAIYIAHGYVAAYEVVK